MIKLLNLNKLSFIFKSINIAGRGIFRGFLYLQSSAGPVGAQTPMIIPVYTYLGGGRIIMKLAKTLLK